MLYISYHSTCWTRAFCQQNDDLLQRTFAFLYRLEREVLCGRLWYDACQTGNVSFPTVLPTSFQDVNHYINTFEPLLCEEAREAVRSSWEEHCEAGHGFSCTITRYLVTAVLVECVFGSTVRPLHVSLCVQTGACVHINVRASFAWQHLMGSPDCRDRDGISAKWWLLMFFKNCPLLHCIGAHFTKPHGVVLTCEKCQ